MAINWIMAEDIEAWTERNPRRAQELLPELVGRLILASADSIIDFHFPHGKAIQYAGYDGYLNSSIAGNFFPAGISVWEFGTDKNILNKFNEDYKKRSLNSGEIEKTTTDFYFVSSRIWSHRTNIPERTVSAKKESDWKDVRIFDATSLKLWLEQCPSVSAWFSKVINMPITGLISLEDYWKSICENTSPILTVDFFMQGRNSFAEKIVDLFDSGANEIIICADSLLESILVMASDFMRSSDIKLIRFFERCVVIQDEHVWNELSSVQHGKAIFVFGFLPANRLNFSKNKCIFPTNKNSPFDRINKSYNRIEIERQKKSDFEEALKNLSCQWDKIRTLEINSKRRFPALLRQITKDPLLKSPAWVSYGDLRILIPALLVGSWEINKPGDVSAIEKLASVSWGDYAKSLSTFTVKEDSPVYNVCNSWMCVSVPEMWDILWDYITQEDYRKFKECIITTFSIKDPIYELPPEQWFAGSIYGKVFDYSNSLLSGLIISLIMFAERNDSDNHFSVTSTAGEVDTIVNQILNDIEDRQGWYTIAPYIPLLSEASPDMVLSKLEEKSLSDDEEFWSMFRPPHDSLTGRAFYTHLLWSLENLTWMPEYVVRTVHVLAHFSEKRFEYKLGNSPNETLYNIFCLWSPKGCLDNANRFSLLQAIINKYPYTGRVLIKKLLANNSQITSNISTPHWRDVEICHYDITRSEYRDEVIRIADLFIEKINPVYDDWEIVFDCFNAFLHNINNIVELCKKQAVQMPLNDLLKLCQQIAEYISRNRKYSDADWSVDEKYLNKLEDLLNRIAPDSPQKYNYYFKWNFGGLHPSKYCKGSYNFELAQQEKLNFRRDALLEIIKSYGRGAVLEVIEGVEDTSDLGVIIAEDVLMNECEWPFIKQILEKNEHVASATIYQLFYKKDFNKQVATLPQDDAFFIAFVMKSLPISRKVLDYIGKSTDAVKAQYWNTVRIWGLDMSEQNLVLDVIGNMLEYNRPFTLIDFLAYSEFADIKIILEILEKAIELYPNVEPNGMDLKNVPHYDMEEIFKKLYTEKEKYSNQIAKLELFFLFAFDYEFEPQCLVDQLLNSPELFMEFLSLAYRQDDGTTGVSTFDDKNRAHHANEVLRRIKRIPGATRENISNTAFANWITKVEDLSKAQSYLTAFSIVVGTILSYSPTGSDGIWPCECVREYLENSNLELLNKHFVIGIFNQRGVHTVTGGVEEKEISNKYFSYSSKLEFLYPRTAAIVREIGKSYQLESKREQQMEMRDFH